MSQIANFFVAVALTMSVGAAISAEPKSNNPNAKVAVTRQAAIEDIKPAAKKTSATAKVRLVDINSAGPNELKTLPGITDAVAEKIISGRPFGSKSQLTTRGIIARDVYEDLKRLVIAKQSQGSTNKLLHK